MKSSPSSMTKTVSSDPRPAATCGRIACRTAAPTFWSSTPTATCACRSAPPRRDVFPGYYDIAAGGVVLAGETYEAGARRELAEEVGIRDVPLAHQFRLPLRGRRHPGVGQRVLVRV